MGDVIFRFGDDMPLDERALLRDISQTPEGHQVQIVVLRNGAQQTIPVVVAAWPRSRWDQRDAPSPVERPKRVRPDLGLTLAPVAPDSRRNLGPEDGSGGVLLSAVSPRL